MVALGSLLREWWRALTGEQRIAVGVFGVAALVIVTFSVLQLRSTILRPFTTDVEALVALRRQLGPTAEELADDQRRADTDEDGISDYDELNVYRTSPYLRDSDSDRIADNLEIAQGTDPNCATGKTCISVVTGTGVATSTPGFVPPTDPGTIGSTPVPGTGNEPPGLPERDVVAIRAYLRLSGVSEEELSNYTDAQILEAYDQSVAEQGSGPEAEADPSAP
jgi:hypothetical protein